MTDFATTLTGAFLRPFYRYLSNAAINVDGYQVRLYVETTASGS